MLISAVDDDEQFIGLSHANFGHAHNGSLCTMEKIIYKILKKGKERQGRNPSNFSVAILG